MLKSMTGYGRIKAETAQQEITVEIRSVNHRYLDLNIKVPRIYGFLEEKIKSVLTAQLVRGKVDVYVAIRAKDGADIKITPNMAVLDGYVKALRSIAAAYDIPCEMGALDLARLPDALSSEKEEADQEVLTADVLGVLKQALAEHGAMCRREGENLCADILSRADTVAELVDFVEKRSPDSVNEYRQRLAARMADLLDGSELQEQRILSEAALFADKVSVTEELVRLRSHLAQLKSMISDDKPVGRKLDFLVQELNREANTIGSKANDYEIAKTVVELKAEIEKIREQIQNLE